LSILSTTPIALIKTKSEVEPADFSGPPQVARMKLVGRGKTERQFLCKQQRAQT